MLFYGFVKTHTWTPKGFTNPRLRIPGWGPSRQDFNAKIASQKLLLVPVTSTHFSTTYEKPLEFSYDFRHYTLFNNFLSFLLRSCICTVSTVAWTRSTYVLLCAVGWMQMWRVWKWSQFWQRCFPVALPLICTYSTETSTLFLLSDPWCVRTSCAPISGILDTSVYSSSIMQWRGTFLMSYKKTCDCLTTWQAQERFGLVCLLTCARFFCVL